MTTLFWVLGILIAFALLVIRFYRPLGAKNNPSVLDKAAKQSIYKNGRFENQIETNMHIPFVAMMGVLWQFMVGGAARRPKHPLPTASFHTDQLTKPNEISFVWFGHSALMMNWRGKLILLDPMFGNTLSPFPWLGGNRYSGKTPLNIEELSIIDAVFLSHDHYDHLDFGSIQRLKNKVKHFFVPLGVSAHLQRWGIDANVISEHDWWDEFEWEGLQIVSAPARHFSGRTINDRNATLWCSWILKDATSRLYFSGDSGYSPHFKEIGEKYGPFDWAFMECGQYHELWKAIHMLPEETVQASIDIRATSILPIHWGAFTLSIHSWFDPIERVVKAAEGKNLRVITPMIGEVVRANESNKSYPIWWKTQRSSDIHTIPLGDINQ